MDMTARWADKQKKKTYGGGQFPPPHPLRGAPPANNNNDKDWTHIVYSVHHGIKSYQNYWKPSKMENKPNNLSTKPHAPWCYSLLIDRITILCNIFKLPAKLI